MTRPSSSALRWGLILVALAQVIDLAFYVRWMVLGPEGGATLEEELAIGQMVVLRMAAMHLIEAAGVVVLARAAKGRGTRWAAGYVGAQLLHWLFYLYSSGLWVVAEVVGDEWVSVLSAVLVHVPLLMLCLLLLELVHRARPLDGVFMQKLAWTAGLSSHLQAVGALLYLPLGAFAMSGGAASSLIASNLATFVRAGVVVFALRGLAGRTVRMENLSGR